MLTVVWSLLGVVAGALLAIQASMNAQLARDIGTPVVAAAISFAAGAVMLSLVSAVVVRAQAITLDWQAPPLWLFLAGGCLGGSYVTAATYLAPRLGAAALMAFLVAGQLLAGMIIDRLGLFGLAVREFSLGRAAGAMLLIAGALLIRAY
ncbi:MAG: DMT family transporter [Rhizobiaceae bacterium]|nr:DMT family transporter [Rhizobiaceae bacterium]